jgi:hypothetical protein
LQKVVFKFPFLCSAEVVQQFLQTFEKKNIAYLDPRKAVD